jgi:hypothetical protein
MPGESRKSCMLREHIEISWSEVMAALAVMGIIADLLLR